MTSNAKDTLVSALERAVELFLAGERHAAAIALRSLPQAPPARTAAATKRGLAAPPPATRLPRVTIAKRVYLETFARDHFQCRYCGRYTIFLQVLSVLSDLFPSELPTHPNWKHDVCHPIYWTHSTTLEHVHAVARGGDPKDPRNLVTACYACQHAKRALSLDELGWSLLPPATTNWDGLLWHYPALCRAAGSSETPNNRLWLTEIARRSEPAPLD